MLHWYTVSWSAAGQPPQVLTAHAPPHKAFCFQDSQQHLFALHHGWLHGKHTRSLNMHGHKLQPSPALGAPAAGKPGCPALHSSTPMWGKTPHRALRAWCKLMYLWNLI